jgi:hypothetical protein
MCWCALLNYGDASAVSLSSSVVEADAYAPPLGAKQLEQQQHSMHKHSPRENRTNSATIIMPATWLSTPSITVHHNTTKVVVDNTTKVEVED